MSTVFTNLNPENPDKTKVFTPDTQIKSPDKVEQLGTLHVVTIGNKGKDAKENQTAQEKKWYDTLISWIAFGSIASLFFVYLAFHNINFLILLPAGPFIGFVVWHIRNFAKNHRSYDEDVLN